MSNVYRTPGKCEELPPMYFICHDHTWFGDEPGPACDDEVCDGRTARPQEEAVQRLLGAAKAVYSPP